MATTATSPSPGPATPCCADSRPFKPVPATSDSPQRGSSVCKNGGGSPRAWCAEKENEQRGAARTPKARSGGGKGFMAPTISAASKASPRKKVLGERNEQQHPVPSSPTDLAHRPKGPPEPAVATPCRLRLSFDGAPAASHGSRHSFGGEEARMENPVCNNHHHHAVGVAAASEDLEPSQAAAVPYDPKTNYLSPRPQFLHCKPNPRIELYRHGGSGVRRLEDGFASDSESSEETDTGREEQRHQELRRQARRADRAEERGREPSRVQRSVRRRVVHPTQSPLRARGVSPQRSRFLRKGRIVRLQKACVAGTSGSHGNTNPPSPPPPSPPIRRTMEEYYVGQHQAREGDLDVLDLLYRHVDAMESMVDAMESMLTAQKKNNEHMYKVLQGQDDVLDQCMQKLQEMKSNWSKTKYDYEHPRQEAAGQAQTMDEGTDPTYQLRFHGSLKARIYTNKPLLEQSDERIEIAIYRDGQIITSGHLSSVRVEIVALESNHSCKGSWTEEDFHRQIQMRRGGQGSVLEGDRSVKLVNGKASLGKVWFSEGSSGTHSREFVLAARIDMSEKIEGLRVEEAFMQPAITVLVERSEANEKSILPMLNDKVHRLKEIAKGGVYARRLEQNGISTVQDFLKALNKDEDKLRQILEMKSKSKSWNVLVGHARECDLRDEHELKPYMVEGENVALFFNCIHDNVGAEFNGRYIAKDKFDPLQKALVDRLKKQAYNELDAIDFQYVMKDNRPIKISANDNAAGSSSIPMSGASPRNTSDHHAHAISQEPDLPLGCANCNGAGPGASEPFPPDHHYTHQNQDQGVAENSIPEGDAIRPDTATTDVDWTTFLASNTLDRPIYTTYDLAGPVSDLSADQFQTFSPPEEPLQIFWTAHSGGGGN